MSVAIAELKELHDLLSEKERELQLRNALFKSVFEHSQVPICVLNNSYQIVEVNDAMCMFLEYTKEELLQVPLEEIVIDRDRSIFDKVRLHSVLTVHKLYKTKSGLVKNAKVVISPVEHDSDMIIVENIVDLTQEEIFTKSVENRTKILEEVFCDEDNFIFEINHDGVYTYIGKYDPEGNLNLNIHTLYKDRPDIIEHILSCFSGHKSTWSVEYGDYLYVNEMWPNTVNGTTYSVIGITKRKKL